ncbi:MAG TPA: fructosamine kinase family protein [Bacillales bacterium]|nr:fructosamine kinase family protein [Bacillales bacterium]
MKSIVEKAAAKTGDLTALETVKPVYGGDINEAYYVKATSGATYFIKLNPKMPADFFQHEAEGLRLLAETGTAAVPEVLFHGAVDGTAVLVLEWIGGGKTAETEERLGREVAELHRSFGEAFGLASDNYIGTFAQQNGWHRDWIVFYRDYRLLPQLELAERKGRLTAGRRKQLETVMARLDHWIPNDVKPSLLHGDLWGGNWIVGENGRPYLIDPAVFYGDHELELAFTELFGGYSRNFYASYRETFPLTDTYEDRRELYQLYYLLIHLNAFGESYGGAVDRVLAKYAG